MRLSGTIPTELIHSLARGSRLSKLQLGKNPISGTLPWQARPPRPSGRLRAALTAPACRAFSWP